RDQADADATRAAAAANRLREQPVRVLADRADIARTRYRDSRSVTPIATISAAASEAPGEIGARATATSDRLHDHAGGIVPARANRGKVGCRRRGARVRARTPLARAGAAKSTNTLRQQPI